ncbi:hypothetical protein HORIV_61810 [Vreelandella olivaria]|uniref:CRISPR-associated nuclease/helicase Cas3 domain-containing protein n=1 Tax=Vreelandella olivaria TaxID=390919 RepID=A0ABM7GSS9_9GAMM|nr:hypothetical protein HORIV_61810 [Halomonas olivaria]
MEAEASPLETHDYPLLTHCGKREANEYSVETRPAVERSVAIEWLEREDEAIERVLAAVKADECVVWVRNTVDDAIRAFQQLRERHPEPARCLLFHARFAMVDRQRIESEVIRRFGKTSTPNLGEAR